MACGAMSDSNESPAAANFLRPSIVTLLVRPLVGALNDLLTRLRGALEHERAFMADAAHELRTPLTALHLQMEMLARAGTEAERVEAMQTLSAGVQRAIRLVEQLLALARQQPRAEPARVRVALEAPRERDRGLHFRIDALLRVDPTPEPVTFDAVFQLNTQQYVIQRNS